VSRIKQVGGSSAIVARGPFSVHEEGGTQKEETLLRRGAFHSPVIIHRPTATPRIGVKNTQKKGDGLPARGEKKQNPLKVKVTS